MSNNYGNLIQRVLSFIVENCDSNVNPTSDLERIDKELVNNFDIKFKEYFKHMECQNIDKSIKAIMELLSSTNAYIDQQAPWSLKKTNPQRMETVLYLVSTIIIKST